MTRRIGNRRAAFTLIELLVVIAIIAVLVGLTTAAVMKAKDAVIRTKNRNQMDQITQATATFCGQEATGRVGYLPPAPFKLQNSYTVNDPEAVYLKQIFPSLNLTATGLPGTPAAPVILGDGNQVAMFFLTGGAVTNYTGFSNNPQQPFFAGAPGEKRLGPYVQLQQNMYAVDATNGQARFIDVYGTPYAIFTAGPKGNYAANPAFNGVTPYSRGGKFENPKTIQIISAGPDKQFGPGGDWSAVNAAGRDDVSNFSTAIHGAGPQ